LKPPPKCIVIPRSIATRKFGFVRIEKELKFFTLFGMTSLWLGYGPVKESALYFPNAKYFKESVIPAILLRPTGNTFSVYPDLHFFHRTFLYARNAPLAGGH
jgi:hypothetical protein